MNTRPPPRRAIAVQPGSPSDARFGMVVAVAIVLIAGFAALMTGNGLLFHGDASRYRRAAAKLDPIHEQRYWSSKKNRAAYLDRTRGVGAHTTATEEALTSLAASVAALDVRVKALEAVGGATLSTNAGATAGDSPPPTAASAGPEGGASILIFPTASDDSALQIGKVSIVERPLS